MTAFADRWPRRTVMVDGPLDGQRRVLPISDRFPDPPFRCHRQGRSAWQHYTRQGDGTYLHVGECGVDNHDGGPLPQEHRCCCGREDYDGRGPWPGGGGQ